MTNWIISSTVLIFAIIVLRFLLKGKMSLRLQYALWAIVLIRLLIPVSIGQTAISVGNWLERILQKEEVHEVYEFTQAELPTMSYQQAYQEVADRYASQGIDIAEIPESEFSETVEYEIAETMTGEWSLAEIAKTIWIIGGVAVGCWFILTNGFFYYKLRISRKEFVLDEAAIASITEATINRCKKKLPVYISDEVDTPCLFGVVHPAIYVTSKAVKDEALLRHVIAHETTHYLHRDYIWGYFRALCLAIHWYNPLVWWAGILSRNDAEMACDEATISYLGEEERAVYGRTLIDLTCEKRPVVLLTATTMTGSGKSIKERIAMIVKKPKMKRYIGVLVAMVSILCVGCTFTGANTADKEQDTNLVTEADDIENATLVTDANIINQITNLLQEENKFDFMLNCEYGYDDTQDMYQINGASVFLVEEASSWEYYEELARKYYSESYIENEFTPFYLGNVYIEEGGKLYRTISDGIVNPIIDSTIKVWQSDNGKYYALITAYSSGYGFYTQGYILDLSEDSIYGFEIVDKPYVETNVKQFMYYVDLTHDGINEIIRVSIGESDEEDKSVKIRIYNEETLTVLYETELLIHPNLGESYFLTSYDGKDYLMYYKPSVNHDVVSCEYEVFSLTNTGEKLPYDAGGIEVSLVNIPVGGTDGVDMTAWKKLAEKENKYFDKAFLLASTLDGKLAYSTESGKITYMEDFSWLSENSGESIEGNLEIFWEEIQELYGT